MALKVFDDDICETYVDWRTLGFSGTAIQFPDLPPLPLRFGVEVAQTDWAPVQGVRSPILAGGRNGIPIVVRLDTASYTFEQAAVVRTTFAPDQIVRAGHNPIIATGFRPDAGIAARQDPGSDTCYSLHNWYQGTTTFEGRAYGAFVHYALFRRKNGVRTLLAEVVAPPWVCANDWWFMELQVWGSDPVNLRIVARAPTMLLATSAPDGMLAATLPALTLYDHPAYGEVNVDQNDPAFDFGAQYGFWAEAAEPSPSTPTPLGDPAWTRDNPARAWVVWEGTDASPDRIRSGQPGIRLYAGSNYAIAKFHAAEMAQTLSIFADEPVGNSARVHGWRTAGVTITSLTSTSGTVSPVSYPTDETWEASVSGFSGIATVTATASDSSTATTTVEWAVVEALASPASLALLTPTATVSLSIADRIKFPGPLKVWNGTAFVDAPFKSFDGTTAS